LQAWKAASLALIRQPVSPITTMRSIRRGGRGSGRPWTAARRAPRGTAASQVSRGKTDGLEVSGVEAVGRSGRVAALARTCIGRARPSIVIEGQASAATTSRAWGVPPAPSTT